MVFASDINPPKRGFFQNSNGDKCWYNTTFENLKYFTSFEEKTCIHYFESDSAMTNNDISKSLLANVITRWYKGTKFQEDTKFKTNPKDWKNAEGLQLKGYWFESSIAHQF